jgi:hypothetical protein
VAPGSGRRESEFLRIQLREVASEFLRIRLREVRTIRDVVREILGRLAVRRAASTYVVMAQRVSR